jgi:hypothetical protein
MESDMTRQQAILSWAEDTFGPVAIDDRERTLRFLEEAIELVHALHTPSDLIHAIVERVYSRDHGNVPREIGQVQMTLEALAQIGGWDASGECDIEFQRVQLIPKSEWTKRHAAKVALGIAT